MEITVTNVKVHEGLSEETLAYTANVLVNGRKVATISNEGHGGMSHLRLLPKGTDADRKLLEQAGAWAAAKPILEDDGTPMVVRDEILYYDLETYCDELAGRDHEEKKLRRRLGRRLKTHTLYTVPGQDGLWEVARPYSPALAELLAKQVQAKHGAQPVIVNAMTLADAAAHVLQHG